MGGIFSSVFSLSPPRVFTYQRAHTPIKSLAPTHREQGVSKEARRRVGREEDGALWEALICTREHTWLLRRLMRHPLNTSVRRAVGGRGGGEAVGLRALGVNSSPQSHPSRPILLPVDKCEIRAWWQPCRGETDAVASAQAYRQPGPRPASVCHPWTLDSTGGKPAPYCELLWPRKYI